MQKPAFIYFDLDDTLLDHRHAERTAIADVCRHFADHFGQWPVADVQAHYSRFNAALWRRYERGEVTRDELKRLRFEQLLDALAVDAVGADDLNACYFDRYARHWTWIEGARNAFEAIAAVYPVGVLTNGFSDIQHAKLARFPELRDRLSASIVSEDVGHMKPHPLLFAHATALAAVPAADILYVGDSFSSDVQGAIGAGWHCAWYGGQPDAALQAQGVFGFTRWPDLLARLL